MIKYILPMKTCYSLISFLLAIEILFFFPCIKSKKSEVPEETVPNHSFLAKLFQYNNSIQLTNYTIDYSIILTRGGIHQVASSEFGTFRNESNSGEFVDIFGYTNQEAKYKEKQEAQAKKFTEKLTRIYNKTNFALVNGSLNPDLIAVDSSDVSYYLQQIVANILPNLIGGGTDTFSFDEFYSTKYPPLELDQRPKVCVLKDLQYYAQKLGFEVTSSCSKYKAWLNYADSSDMTLKTTFQKTFKKGIDFFVKLFKGREDFQIPILGSNKFQSYYNLTEANLQYNLTLWYNILKLYFYDRDYYSDSIKPEMEPPEEIGIEELQDMLKFLNFEYILYSEIHAYISVSPVFNLLLSEFNNKMHEKDTNATLSRNLVIFGVSDRSLLAIYKMFNYDGEYLSGGKYISLRKEPYNYFPFLAYTSCMSFELWSVPSNVTLYESFIAFRENLADNPLFVVPISKFVEMISAFMISPDYSEKERSTLCGKLIT